MELYNIVGYQKVTDLHAKLLFNTLLVTGNLVTSNRLLLNTLLVTGNLVTSNEHSMELYNLVGYHKVTDLLVCIAVIQYTSGNR